MIEAEVLAEMDEAAVLDFADARHEIQRDAESDLFRAAYQFAVVNHPDKLGPQANKHGRAAGKTLGGPGTPPVAERAAARFGARIARSPYAAQQLIADALDVYLRLPEIAGRLDAGEVRVTYARHVAHATRELSAAEAAWVDHEVVEAADGRICWSRFEALVEGKVAVAAPALAREKEEEARQARFAKKVGGANRGMASFLTRADEATITRIDEAVTDAADQLAESMPEASVDERRVEALLRLCHPDAEDRDQLDLRPTVQLYLHCYASPVTEYDTDGNPVPGVGRLEGHGPVTEAWIRDVLGPRCRFKVTPVLDLAGQSPVDAYEIPRRHREAVRLMTPADVFPYASNTGRGMDIDHTQAYADGGESAIGNYGPLTRSHHRIKTFDNWEVRQPFPGIYIWRDPHGIFYLVDHTGTRRLPRPDEHRERRQRQRGYTPRHQTWNDLTDAA